MGFPTALSSSTPESLPPAPEHYLGDSAGLTIFERLAALTWRNEVQLGSLALRLGRSFHRALTCGITPTRHRLHYMFNVQFTWQSPFILLVHSDFQDAPKARRDLNVEEVAAIVVDCAYKLHVEAGPGLLESVYEVVLARMLAERGLRVSRQVPVTIELMSMKFDEGFRADLIVHDLVLVELKSVESLAPVHGKQVLTYLRLRKMPLGLLINFGAATFKEGIKRIVNQHRDFASSRLCVNQIGGFE
jgi:GxxExxY protein